MSAHSGRTSAEGGPTALFGPQRPGIGVIRSFRIQFRSGRLVSRTIGARLGNSHLTRGTGRVPRTEPTMINLKVSSSAAVMALVLAMAAPGTSFAQAVGRGAARG